jgi:GNAT superfamily N-acetyltransferase
VNPSVREAAESDLPAVLGLYAQPELDGAWTLPIDAARETFRRILAYPDYRLYVAEVDGRVIGTFTLIVMENLSHRGAPSALVESVAVAPEWQSRGIGAAMMEHARGRCRARGCYKMALSSNLRRERAHAFYDRLGFERHGYSFRVAP